MGLIVVMLILFAGMAAVGLIADYAQLRIIRFQRASLRGTAHWEFAFDEPGLFAKLDGEMAEVSMPARPLVVRLWRKVRPLRFAAEECEEVFDAPSTVAPDQVEPQP